MPATEMAPEAVLTAGDAHESLPPPPVPEVQRDEPARQAVPRGQVQAVVDGGMGRLLQLVQVEPARQNGRFMGHRIEALPDAWRGGPVRVGDVVVRLNGSTLESPDKAYQALQTLAVASEVVVEVIREGVPLRSRLAIQ